MNKEWDAIWINGWIATCEDGYGLIENGAIAAKNEKIVWIGKTHELPNQPENLAQDVYDLQGSLLTPGLIDCHTHIIFSGNRANEFEWRLQGISYEEIIRQGGGIQSTVLATRLASEASLFQQSLKRAQGLMRSGVTTLEIKSGYGLDLESELKILRVAKQIEKILPITISTTFLGAHTTPIEYRNQTDAYIDLVCNEMIPIIAKEKLADAVDVFCEKIAFNLDQTKRVFKTAKQYNLAIKCHAEQLSDSGGAKLAAEYQALSVDHLEHLSLDGVKAIADAGSVAVLLPGAFYFLRETKFPPVELLRQYHVPMAIATDCNPGTSPMLSLQLMLNMACTLFRLTPEEALLGVTKYAARALGLEKTRGTLKIGKVADFALWKVNHPIELAYYAGDHLLNHLVYHGKIVNPTVYQ